MKKHFIKTLILLITLSLILTGCGIPSNNDSDSTEKVFKIGISQFVEHPALDCARDGFIDGLKEAGFEDGKH